MDNARLFKELEALAEERRQLLDSERNARSESERLGHLNDCHHHPQQGRAQSRSQCRPAHTHVLGRRDDRQLGMDQQAEGQVAEQEHGCGKIDATGGRQDRGAADRFIQGMTVKRKLPVTRWVSCPTPCQVT